MDDDAMIDRALKAYFRPSTYKQQPSRGHCEVRAIEGRWYVVLRNGGGTLGVYEVRGNPLAVYKLKGLPTGKYPAELDTW